MNYIIGVGGVGSWLAASMAKLVGPGNLTLIDGDTLEAKNLDRQLFKESDIGMFKSAALARALEGQKNIEDIPEFYYTGLVQLEPHDWLLVCVDNHPARLSALESCDYYGCSALFAANETHSSEAYAYLPEWRDTERDPRRYYPEIRTSTANDPRNRAIGCTGEAQVANRQLVSANFSAAALIQNLYVIWAMEAKKVDREARKFLPHKLVSNLSLLRSESEADLELQEAARKALEQTQEKGQSNA